MLEVDNWSKVNNHIYLLNRIKNLEEKVEQETGQKFILLVNCSLNGTKIREI